MDDLLKMRRSSTNTLETFVNKVSSGPRVVLKLSEGTEAWMNVGAIEYEMAESLLVFFLLHVKSMKN